MRGGPEPTASSSRIWERDPEAAGLDSRPVTGEAIEQHILDTNAGKLVFCKLAGVKVYPRQI